MTMKNWCYDEIAYVVEESGRLVLDRSSWSAEPKKFTMLGNRNKTFQLTDLPGGEKKNFVKELIAGKTYLKTTEGKYVVFDQEQNRVIEDSRPGLEVDFHAPTADPWD